MDEAAAKWFPSMYCPFAANLQIIFYQAKPSDPVLVKFLLNEKETAIPAIKPVEGVYYSWNDVKAYVNNR